MSHEAAKLFVVSGPSGVGKGTLDEAVCKRIPSLTLTVSATTRPPRDGETNGVDYHFLSESEFDRGIAEGSFIEWAHVHEHRYGTFRTDIDRLLSSGRSPLLEIDVQGALNVRKQYDEAVLIFIMPPSLAVLEQRLRARGTEDESSLATRMRNAISELQLADLYDEIVVNDELATAITRLETVITSHLTDGGLHDVCDQA